MKTKKIVSIISGFCMLAASYALPAYAEEITMTSNPQDGAVNVSSDLRDIVLTFSDLPDPGSFTENTVKLNGSSDLICDYGYDDLNDPYSITLQLASDALEAGERYVISLDQVAVGDSYFSGTTRFVTDIRDDQTVLLENFDSDTVTGAWGGTHSASDGILTYVAEGSNNGAYLPSYYSEKINMSNLIGFLVRFKIDTDTTLGFYYRTEFASTEDEAKHLYTDVQGGDDFQEVLIPANSNMAGGMLTYLRLHTTSAATLLVDSISAVTEKGHTSEVRKYFYFTGGQDYFRHADQGGITWTPADDGVHFSGAAGVHVFSMGVDQQVYRVGKIRFVAKKIGDADAGFTACFFSGWYTYQYSIMPVSFTLTDEFAVYEYDISDIWHDGNIAQMSLILDKENTEIVVRSIEFLPYHYDEAGYFAGKLQRVTNYGMQNESVLTETETAANITTILPSFWNFSGADKEIVLISAVYQNGKLVSTAAQKATVSGKSTLSEPLAATVEIPEGEGYTVRSFFWNGQTMMPYESKTPTNH